MAKFYGNIGYAQMVEKKPGVWKEEIITHPYYGELVRNTRRLQSSDQLNDNITVANENFYSMRYVEFNGAKWKISNVEVRYPRLILTLGGIYNGNET